MFSTGNNIPEEDDLKFELRREKQLRGKLMYDRWRLDNVEGAVEDQKGRNKSGKDRKNTWKDPIAVLVFACNRPLAVRDHVRKLLDYRPSAEQFPIFVSQDCNNDAVRSEVLAFGDRVHYIEHQPADERSMPNDLPHRTVYYRIARHYKLALDYVFLEKRHTSVIITEDDLDVAPDFFSYFVNTRYLLEIDEKLWCVTAWNDNGKTENIDTTATSKLYRSDFFAGLGWMMTLKTWEELGPVWPDGFWDDWMREPAQRKGRQCIRPEISRTGMMHHGKSGASKGLFFSQHLARVKVNDVYTDFENIDLDYLLPSNYDKKMREEVTQETESLEIDQVTSFVLKPENNGRSLRVKYTGNTDFVEKAGKLGMMNDFKAGIPRTAYDGIVTCFINGIRIYLVPEGYLVRE